MIALACVLTAGLANAQVPVATDSAVPATALPPRTFSGGAAGSLPSLGENSDMTAATERRIGDRIARSIYRDPDYIDDPVLVDYVQGIWLPLMAAARARGELHAELDERFAFQIFLLRDASVNAFALPGGYFGLHTGLLSTVSSADELAAVLGHELSHVTQRHISRLMTQQSRQTPWMIAAMVLGALAANKSSGAANAAIVGGQALAMQNQLNFSRDMEREADRVGFGVMTDAGYESRGVATMFDKLQQASRLNDNGSFPYLRSHPLTTERIAEAQARVQLASAAEGPLSADKLRELGQDHLLHAMMAARARIFSSPGVDVLRTMVAEAQRRPATIDALGMPASDANVRDAGALYGGAFAAIQLRDYAVARRFITQLSPLVAAVPRAKNVLALLTVELDLLAGQTPSAPSLADIARGSSRADVLVYSRAMMAAGQARIASERLQTWVATHPKDPMAWQLLSVALGQQNLPIRAIRADAESRAAELDYAAALDRIKAAQTMMRTNPGTADYMEASIVDTRARQFDSILKEQALQDKIDK